MSCSPGEVADETGFSIDTLRYYERRIVELRVQHIYGKIAWYRETAAQRG